MWLITCMVDNPQQMIFDRWLLINDSRWMILDDWDKRFTVIKTWPNSAAQVIAKYNGVDNDGGQLVKILSKVEKLSKIPEKLVKTISLEEHLPKHRFSINS